MGARYTYLKAVSISTVMFDTAFFSCNMFINEDERFSTLLLPNKMNYTLRFTFTPIIEYNLDRIHKGERSL